MSIIGNEMPFKDIKQFQRCAFWKTRFLSVTPISLCFYFHLDNHVTFTIYLILVVKPIVRCGMKKCKLYLNTCFFFIVYSIELKAVVLGAADLYVKTGSDINLTCKISKGPHELGTVFWYKGMII